MTGSMNRTPWKRAGWVAWNVAAAMSLLLCLATLALWLRSYWDRDVVAFGRKGGDCHAVQSILGRLHVLTDLGGGCAGGAWYSADRLSPDAVWHGGMSGYPPAARWRLGFVWQTYDQSSVGPGRIFWHSKRLIVVPYWFPACLSAIVPIAWAAGIRRRIGVLDAMLIVAAVALALAAPAWLARWMIRSAAGVE